MATFKWTTSELENFLPVANQELEKGGFSFYLNDTDAGCSVWSKPYLEGCTLDVNVWPRRGRDGSLSIAATLSITSNRQAEVEHILGIQHGSDPIPLLSAPVGWLAVKFCIVPRFDDALDMMTGLEQSVLAEPAMNISRLLRETARAFVVTFPTAMDLARLLAGLAEFTCGSARGNGPVSSDPEVFAAVLAHDAGETLWASRLLQNKIKSAHDSSANVVLEWLKSGQ